jgi:Asp-tRNA(Asn)/Glu-tRNA(Gln) amidotransferase A subunit family amidase
MTHLSLGTDGGGSIRIPASFCGVVGHKPTFGLVPKDPGFKSWKSLSVDGPLATSVRDAALMLSVVAGATPADDTTVPVPFRFDAAPVRGLRVAYSADLGGLPVDPDVRTVFASALRVLEGLGCVLTEAHPAVEANQTPLWNTIALAEGFASEGPLLDEWRDRMSPGTADIVEAGRAITASSYVDALHARARYTRSFLEFFDRYDVLVTPAMQLTAFPVGLLGPASIEGRPVDPFFDDWCAICLPANLTGAPATCVPAGVDRDGLPVGLQILGPRFADALTLRLAAAFEAANAGAAGRP